MSPVSSDLEIFARARGLKWVWLFSKLRMRRAMKRAVRRVRLQYSFDKKTWTDIDFRFEALFDA